MAQLSGDGAGQPIVGKVQRCQFGQQGHLCGNGAAQRSGLSPGAGQVDPDDAPAGDFDSLPGIECGLFTATPTAHRVILRQPAVPRPGVGDADQHAAVAHQPEIIAGIVDIASVRAAAERQQVARQTFHAAVADAVAVGIAGRVEAGVRKVRQAAGHGNAAQVAVGALHQVHGADVHVRPKGEPPASAAAAEASVQPFGAFLEVCRVQRPRLAGRQCESDRPAGSRSAVVVPPNDGDARGLVRGIDEPQAAPGLCVARRVEPGRVVPLADSRRPVVNRSGKTIRCAHVDLYVKFQRALQQEPPVAVAVAETGGQAVCRVTVLQVVGVDTHGLTGLDIQRHGTVASPGVVKGVDPNRSLVGTIRDAQHPQPLRVAGRREQRDIPVGRPRGRKVRQGTGGIVQQRHDLDLALGEHQQPPVAVAVTEPAAQEAGLALLQFLRVERQRPAAGQSRR